MTATQARQLLVGTVVMWNGNSDELGTVRKIGRNGFYVDWDDGQIGWIHFEDAASISAR